jgi:hypothetical protein
VAAGLVAPAEGMAEGLGAQIWHRGVLVLHLVALATPHSLPAEPTPEDLPGACQLWSVKTQTETSPT